VDVLPPLPNPNYFTPMEHTGCVLQTKYGGLETTSQSSPLVEFEDKFFPQGEDDGDPPWGHP